MGYLTAFGREVRKLRIEKEETLRDMAKALNLSAAFVSAVETGSKSIPEGLVQRICKHYRLDTKAAQHLKEMAERSAKNVTIELDKAKEDERVLVAEFARRFPSLSEEKKQQLKRLLSNE